MRNTPEVPAVAVPTQYCPADFENVLRLFPDKIKGSGRLSAKDQLLAILSSCRAELPKHGDAALSIVIGRFAQGDRGQAVRDILTDVWNNKPHLLPKAVPYPTPDAEAVCNADLIVAIGEAEYGLDKDALRDALANNGDDLEAALGGGWGDEVENLCREVEAGLAADTPSNHRPKDVTEASEAPLKNVTENVTEASKEAKNVTENVTEVAPKDEDAPTLPIPFEGVGVSTPGMLPDLGNTVTSGNTENGPGDPKKGICYYVTELPRILEKSIESNNGVDTRADTRAPIEFQNTPVTSNFGNIAPAEAVLGDLPNHLEMAEADPVEDVGGEDEGDSPVPIRPIVIDPAEFPDVSVRTVNKVDVFTPKKTDRNFQYLTQRLGYTFWYDETTWETKVDQDGVCLSDCPGFNLNVLQTTLHSELERVGISVPFQTVPRWVKWLAAQDVRNPFKVWVESVPHTWDGTPYLDEWCRSIIQDPDSGITDEVKDLLLKKHLVGTINLQYSLRPNHPYAVMLIGNQGVGKGRKLHELFTGAFDGFATWARFDNTNFDPTNKDCIRQAMTCVMYEISEANLRKKCEEGTKGFISTQEHNHTDKYENDAVKKPRRVSIWITCNFAESLTDSSGARRFWPIKVAKTTWDYSEGFSIAKVWADAKHLYDTGFRTYFDGLEEQEFFAYKSQFIVARSTDIQFEMFFQTDAPIEKWTYETFPAICTYLNLDINRANANHIKAALRKIAKNPTLDTVTRRIGNRTAKCILCPPLIDNSPKTDDILELWRSRNDR